MKIHTPDTYANLNDKQARAHATELATELFETNHFKTKLSKQIGMSYEGVQNWFRENNRPPFLAIAYLSSQLERKKAWQVLIDLRSVHRRIENIWS